MVRKSTYSTVTFIELPGYKIEFTPISKLPNSLSGARIEIINTKGDILDSGSFIITMSTTQEAELFLNIYNPQQRSNFVKSERVDVDSIHNIILSLFEHVFNETYLTNSGVEINVNIETIPKNHDVLLYSLLMMISLFIAISDVKLWCMFVPVAVNDKIEIHVTERRKDVEMKKVELNYYLLTQFVLSKPLGDPKIKRKEALANYYKFLTEHFMMSLMSQYL